MSSTSGTQAECEAELQNVSKQLKTMKKVGVTKRGEDWKQRE
jgi:predicted transcriptional regulator